MIKKPTREQESEMRRQLTPWMIDRNLPLVLFDKLIYYNKVWLHNIVCVGIVASPAQLWDLHTDLGSPLMHKARVEPSVSKESLEPTLEQLNEFFSPQASAGNIPYFKRF